MDSGGAGDQVVPMNVGRGRRGFLPGALGWALLSWGAGVARGDGKVLPPVLMPQEVAMPDQRAILAWSEGVQRMPER